MKTVKKLLKFIVVATVIANMTTLLYIINDFRMLRKQIVDVNKIRISLPEDFKECVANKIFVSTKEIASNELLRASQEIIGRNSEIAKNLFSRLANDVSTNLASIAREVQTKADGINAHNKETVDNFISRADRSITGAISNLTAKHDAAISEMRDVVDNSVIAMNKLCKEQEELSGKKVKAAETAFSLYQADPTNEIAILYLQIAIRKNPSELKYIKALRDVVERSGLIDGLFQEYQAMLSYCLDEASENCFKDLAAMVMELRKDIAALEIGKEEIEDDTASASELKKILSENKLVVAFHPEAKKVAERRLEILKELISIEGETDTYNVERSSAELIGFVARAKEQIDSYIKQAKRAIEHACKNVITNETELRDSLTALGATVVSQPILLAQQTVQSLYGIDLSKQPTNIADECDKEFRTLDKNVQRTLESVDRMKAEKIISFVDSLSKVSTEHRTYTSQLEELDTQGKIISKYIGCISNMEIANEVLSKQLEILDKSRELQRKRMKIYQTNAAVEMKEIAQLIKQYKDKAWRKEYKKNQAEPLLKRLVRINPALLVPEINELYQYEYSQLTTDFNAWIEKKNAYEYKASFMVELEKIEKNKLEDL